MNVSKERKNLVDLSWEITTFHFWQRQQTAFTSPRALNSGMFYKINSSHLLCSDTESKGAVRQLVEEEDLGVSVQELVPRAWLGLLRLWWRGRRRSPVAQHTLQLNTNLRHLPTSTAAAQSLKMVLGKDQGF